MNSSELQDDADAAWRELVFPAAYSNPLPQKKYHLIVIGAGPAGLVTAIAAAGLGAKVALIERSAMGGDCLNVGCVPSKALLEYTAKNAASPDFAAAFKFMRHVRTAIAHHDSVERYTKAGVDVFLGAAKFTDETHVQVADKLLRGRRIIIATGASASLPPIPGLAEASALTNETVFDLASQPRSLAIIGGGPIGCELALAFTRLGTTVDLFERADRIIPTEHPHASRIVADALIAQGVRLHLKASIAAIERHNNRIEISADNTRFQADEVLVAAGRKANTEGLNLAAVNVALSDDGLIDVDAKLRTSNRRIYAAGDVCSRTQFTHNADAHARIVVQNALFLPTASKKRLLVPHCTYTTPEVAQVGKLPDELDRDGPAYDLYRLAFGDMDRGKTQDDDTGFVEVSTIKGSDQILGCTIVGHDAGEQIAPICIAMNEGKGLGSFSRSILPYPTRAEYLRRLADQVNRRKLTPSVQKLMHTWFRWTG